MAQQFYLVPNTNNNYTQHQQLKITTCNKVVIGFANGVVEAVVDQRKQSWRSDNDTHKSNFHHTRHNTTMNL